MTWQNAYVERYYRGRAGWQDGTTEFHDLCKRYIPAGGTILEIGAGPANDTTRYLAARGELHGLDPDPDVLDNPALASAAVLRDNAFPFPDDNFDACVSNYVLEHVADPSTHLREVRRVLRPGGHYVFRTPNIFHYVTLVARLTPHGFHRLVANRLRNLPTAAHDPYPTVYAFNSRRAVRRLAAAEGLEVELLRMVEKEPSYGLASRLLFLLFTAYERAVNATALAQDLRSNIFGVLRKPDGEIETDYRDG